MDRIYIFLHHAWNPTKQVVRDITDIDRNQLEQYLSYYFHESEFTALGDETIRKQWTPGQLLAAWVKETGPDRAGMVLLRRRIEWLNLGAAIGLFVGLVFAALFMSELEQYPRGVVLVSSLLLGACVGAGLGWFAANLVDAWQDWKSWRNYLAETSV